MPIRGIQCRRLSQRPQQLQPWWGRLSAGRMVLSRRASFEVPTPKSRDGIAVTVGGPVVGRRGGSFGCAVMLSQGVTLLTFTPRVWQLSSGVGGFRTWLANQRC
jgi:hypothetical protein